MHMFLTITGALTNIDNDDEEKKVGTCGSDRVRGTRVSASSQICALKTLLHTAAGYLEGDFLWELFSLGE